MSNMEMSKQPENKMGTMPISTLLLNMSLPMMVSMLVQALYNIVDSIFVAQINENATKAVSLAFPMQMLMIAVSVGTGVGMSSLMSRKLGEKNFKDAEAAANQGFFLAACSYAAFLVFFIKDSIYLLFILSVSNLGVSFVIVKSDDTFVSVLYLAAFTIEFIAFTVLSPASPIPENCSIL